jgi:hypothetical protein
MFWFGPRVPLEWVMQLPGGIPPAEGTGCLYCREPIVHGDSGVRLAYVKPADDGQSVSVPAAAHFACQMRQMVGSAAHQRRECSCFVPGSGEHDDPALSVRENALAATAAFLENAVDWNSDTDAARP